MKPTKTPVMTKSRLVHELPGFVTEEEIAQIAAFEKKLDSFHSHVQLSVVTFAAERKELACNAYTANPSDENFSAFKTAAMEEGLLSSQIIPGSVLAVVEGVREGFIKREIAPFVKPILERGLDIARRNLDEITIEEERRHKQLTGGALVNSGIVAAARAPVIELERLLKAMEKMMHSLGLIFPYLRAQRAD